MRPMYLIVSNISSFLYETSIFIFDYFEEETEKDNASAK